MIEKKPQSSFRLSYNENARIAEVEGLFPSENIKELFFKLIDHALKPTANNANTDVAALEKALRELGENKLELHTELVELSEKVNVLQKENTELNGVVERLQAMNTIADTDFNALKTEYENIEKEFVIHPNPEQVNRLTMARDYLTRKHSLVFNSTTEFLDQLIDASMDRLGYKYAELK